MAPSLSLSLRPLTSIPSKSSSLEHLLHLLLIYKIVTIRTQQCAQDMPDLNAALAAAFTALTAVLANMQANPPFKASAPFDLSLRAGSHAYTAGSAPLDDKWDRTIAKFPLFLIALHVCATTVYWGTAAPNAILIYVVAGEDKNLFMDHNFISRTIIQTARMARTNNRAIQNSRPLYKCLNLALREIFGLHYLIKMGTFPLTKTVPFCSKSSQPSPWHLPSSFP